MNSKKLTVILILLVALVTARAQGPTAWHQHQWTGYGIKVPYTLELPASLIPDSADLLIDEARRHLGKPYRYGGKGPSAFDCAGFARYVYLKFGYSLPGGSGSQYSRGRKIKNTRQLQKGDLVFWQGRERNGRVGHTGIVTEVDTTTGRFRFIHAATHSGVIHSYSTEEYYACRYVGACRLLGDRTKPEDPIPAKAKKKRQH